VAYGIVLNGERLNVFPHFTITKRLSMKTIKKVYVAEKDLSYKEGKFNPANGNFMITCPCCQKIVPMAEQSRKKGLILDGTQKIMVMHWDKGYRTKKHKCPHGNQCSASKFNRFNSQSRSGKRASSILINCHECKNLERK